MAIFREGSVSNTDQVDQQVNSGDTYSFRRLTLIENEDILKLKDDPKQLELTRTLLSKPELQPIGALQIDGKEFFVGKIIKRRNHDQAVMYYKDSSTGKFIPRALYRSRSDGGWRSCPGSEKDGSYSKGAWLHYTQETKPHEDIIRYFDEAESVGHFATSEEDIIEKYFQIGHGYPWDTFWSETDCYMDEAKRHWGLRICAAGYYGDGMSEQFKKLDFSGKDLIGFLPDFEKGPFKITKGKHTLLGPITSESYSASLHGRPIKWVMAYDSKGRVWVDRITFLDTEINSYGVSPEVINSGALTDKPLDDRMRTGRLNKEDAVYFDEHYVDITPLLDNLLPIQQFRKVRNIFRAPTPGVEHD